jgi:hypothetical protein
MMLLHIAVGGPRDPLLHAAAPGDRRALCGREMEKVTDEVWGSGAGPVCDRCASAAAVLRTVHAV